MSELLFKPVTELAALVRSGEISARELVQASLDRIEAVDGEINAFVHVDAEGALAAADAIKQGDERPFAGVPIAIKDEVPVKGMPLTVGSDLFGDFVPEYDTSIVRRFRDAGFVIVGKTNMPEMGILPVTEPRRHGPTRNPWDTSRTPGGSSGGSGAAVAAGMVPVAHGKDGGGSVRIPAACCGLVGLKVQRGRVSNGPEQGENFLTHSSVLTRTVAETAELLDVMAGYEPGDSNWLPAPAEPFAEAARREPGRLRIGVTTKSPIPAPLDPRAERAVQETAELLSELGHEVEQVEAPWGEEDLLPVFARVFCTNIAVGVFFAGMVSGREPSEELLEPLTWDIWRGVNDYGALDYPLAKLQLEALAREIAAWWSGLDLLLTPALAERPVPIGEIDPCSPDPWADFGRSGEFTPFTAMFNCTGQPAISLPLFEGDDGLPLAVQLAGPPAGEALLLQLGAQLEEVRPWGDRRPPLAAATGA